MRGQGCWVSILRLFERFVPCVDRRRKPAVRMFPWSGLIRQIAE
jgi:hypothetical protein